jgi:hypothetical protein
MKSRILLPMCNPLIPSEYFLHFGIFTPYVQTFDSELSNFFVFNENLISCNHLHLLKCPHAPLM